MISLEPLLTDTEIAQESCLGLGATWHCNGIDVPPVKAGHMLLFDAVGSPYAGYDKHATLYRVQEVVTILHRGQRSVQPIFEYISGADKKWETIPARIADNINTDNVDAVHEQIEAQIEYAFGGFEQIHGSGEAVTDRFDMVWASNMAQVSGYNINDVLWKYPLVTIGHVVAAEARANGEDVERPKDIEKAMEKLLECRKSEQN